MKGITLKVPSPVTFARDRVIKLVLFADKLFMDL